MMSIYLALRDQRRLALIFLILSSFVREDVIFYLAPLLLTFHKFLKIRSPFIIISILAVPSSAYLVARGIFSNTESLLKEEYLGIPTFSHVSLDFYITRLKDILQFNAPILLCLFGLCAIALKIRNRVAILLFLQGTCYIFLVSLSKSDAKGTLLFYYNLPIWLITLLMTIQLTKFPNISHLAIRKILIWVIASSLVALPTNNFAVYYKTLITTEIPAPPEIGYVLNYAKERQIKLDNHFFVYAPGALLPTDFIGEQTIQQGCILTLRSADTSKVLVQSKPSFPLKVKIEKITKNFKVSCI